MTFVRGPSPASARQNFRQLPKSLICSRTHSPSISPQPSFLPSHIHPSILSTAPQNRPLCEFPTQWVTMNRTRAQHTRATVSHIDRQKPIWLPGRPAARHSSGCATHTLMLMLMQPRDGWSELCTGTSQWIQGQGGAALPDPLDPARGVAVERTTCLTLKFSVFQRLPMGEGS